MHDQGAIACTSKYFVPSQGVSRQARDTLSHRLFAEHGKADESFHKP
jgi:hypothetical protein